MSDLRQRIAELSPAKQELLVRQLKKKRGIVYRTGSSLANSVTTGVDLNTEAILDPTIRPESVPGEFVTYPNHILLTGGTGFLGAFLLHELLQQTQAEVYCLVRAPNVESGARRLRKNLEFYSLWEQRFSFRIIPVLGDLSKAKLGLADDEFQLLAGKIDTIYHSAALLNFIYPYTALKAMNVLGTQEVLRLASQIKRKTVHHISSFAVFESAAYANSVVQESDNLEHSKGIYLGYSQSKWVAEKLVLMARSRGLPVCIYRLPFISGHSQTGVWNTSDFNCLMVKGCVQMGSAPSLDYLFTMVPVDYVSRAIVHLSRQKESAGKAFHLNNPHPLHVSQVNAWCRTFGYPIQYIPYDQWQAQLVNTVQSQENPLYTLRPFFLERWSEEQLTIPELYLQSRSPQINCQSTLDALAGTSISCPPMDFDLLSTYFSYFLRSGFLDAESLGRWRVFWFQSRLFIRRQLRLRVVYPLSAPVG